MCVVMTRYDSSTLMQLKFALFFRFSCKTTRLFTTFVSVVTQPNFITDERLLSNNAFSSFNS